MPARRLAALVLVLSACGAFAASSGGARPDLVRTLVGNGGFESSLSGWSGYRASLSRVQPGAEGSYAARVSLTSTSTSNGYSISPAQPQVGSGTVGVAYTAAASVRSPQTGRSLCLRIREQLSGTLVGSATACVASGPSWQRVGPVAYTAKRSGTAIDVYAYAWNVSAGDSFDLDAISLAPAVTAPVVPPIVPPLSGVQPWYGSASPFNQPIAPGSTVDAGSPAMIERLVAGAGGGFAIAARAWTTPFYEASSATPKTRVALTASWAPKRVLAGVPIPSAAIPDPQADAHLSIVDASSGCEYDFWQAKRAADGSWSASWANAIKLTGNGIYERGLATTASGFANGLGKIRPEELAAGEINHALFFAFPSTKAGGPVAPATSSDGRSTVAGAIPEGARLQLDPALDLETLGLAPWQKTIARALQRYGMILGDSGGTVSLYALHTRSFGGLSYPWGDVDYAYLPKSLLGRFRVLSLGPQLSTSSYPDASGCATFE